jgi:EAL domain-containing protein (putative c-di-GMP-specific phosphodiesterase class I)
MGSNQSESRSRSNARYGSASAQVEDLLRFIEQQWTPMASDNCIPVKVALQLMDSSSLGLADQYDQFLEVHKQLKNALKVIVNEHHQGFNSSIGTFHKIQAAIHASQIRVRALRAGLVQAKNSLSSAKPELRAFAQSSQSYDTMLQVLGTIEQLQQVPEKLEAQISEKRFIGAVDTLLEALKLIRKPEMECVQHNRRTQYVEQRCPNVKLEAAFCKAQATNVRLCGKNGWSASLAPALFYLAMRPIPLSLNSRSRVVHDEFAKASPPRSSTHR